MKHPLHCTLLTLALAFITATHLAAEVSDPVARAKAALTQNDLAAAETLLAPLATGEKPDAAACHQLGHVRLRQGRVEDAIALFEQASALDPKADYFAALGMGIGRRMSQVSFMQQAFLSSKLKKAFAKAVELDPNHLGGLVGLTRFYLNAPEIAGGSLEQAREYAERVRKLDPFMGELELGAIAEHEEDFARALTHYEAATAHNPNHGWANYLCGRTLVHLKRDADARTRFEKALMLDPKIELARKALAALGNAKS